MRDALSFPIAVSERISFIYLDKVVLERDGHSLVARESSTRTVIPIGKTAVLFLGPGSTVSHAAVALCALEGALLTWVGEGGVRLYATGTGRSLPDNVLKQARLRLDPAARLAAARKLYFHMFGEPAPERRSIEQLRGLEGSKVKAIFQNLASKYQLTWSGRTHDLRNPLNLGISTATAAIYGLAEAVILSLGYSPSIGFVHSGDERSFVFDLADTEKFKTVVPIAFETVSASAIDVEKRVRLKCRDLFYQQKLAEKFVSILENVFRADGDN